MIDLQPTMRKLVARALAPIHRRVQLLVTRAVLQLVDDSKKFQEAQLVLLAGEVADGVEHLQPYGFTSVPLEGAEGLAFAVGSNRSHVVVLNLGNRAVRMKDLVQGEVAVFTDEGDHLVFKRGHIAHLVANDVRLGSNTATTYVALADPVEDELSALRATVDALVTLFNAHVQPTPMGPTGVPVVPATGPAAVGSVAATKVKAV